MLIAQTEHTRAGHGNREAHTVECVLYFDHRRPTYAKSVLCVPTSKGTRPLLQSTN